MFLRRLRTSLLCLLMLVLPAQALAGALIPLCLAALAHGEQILVEEHRNYQGHAPHSAKALEQDGEHLGVNGSHVGCPLCASSCHTSGAVSSLSLNIPFVPQVELALKAYVSFDGYIADIPRRPPRQVTL